MSGEIGQAVSELIPSNRRIGIEEVRRALIIGDLWNEMKARIREEEFPVMARAPDVAEIQERADIAMTLANLRNETPEPVLVERLQDMPLVEQTRVYGEEREITSEGEERVVVTTPAQSSTQCNAATE